MKTKNESNKDCNQANCSPLDKIKEYLKAYDDETLDKMCAQAKIDLEESSQKQPNSDWHESCFSAVIILNDEKQRRFSESCANAVENTTTNKNSKPHKKTYEA